MLPCGEFGASPPVAQWRRLGFWLYAPSHPTPAVVGCYIKSKNQKIEEAKIGFFSTAARKKIRNPTPPKEKESSQLAVLFNAAAGEFNELEIKHELGESIG